jgi:hypothetical protein
MTPEKRYTENEKYELMLWMGGVTIVLFCEQTKGLVHELIVMNIEFEVFKVPMQ